MVVSKIKELRVRIDGISQLVSNLNNEKTIDFKTGFNLLKTRDSLLMAKGWLGKLLGELGTDNPYGSGYKTKEDIVPTQDVAKNLFEVSDDLESWGKDFSNKNTIEKLDWLRTNIEVLCNQIKNLDNNTSGPSVIKTTRESAICRTNSWTHLCEAKMWLGFELGRIRDEK